MGRSKIETEIRERLGHRERKKENGRSKRKTEIRE